MNRTLGILAEVLSDRMDSITLKEKKWSAATFTFIKGDENSFSIPGSRPFLKIPTFFDFEITISMGRPNEELAEFIGTVVRQDLLPKADQALVGPESEPVSPPAPTRCASLLSGLLGRWSRNSE